MLTQHFLRKYSEANGVSLKPLSDEAAKAVESYNWPGNVRELENAMNRAVILSTAGKIAKKDIFLPNTPVPDEHQNDSTLAPTPQQQTEKADSVDFIGQKLADVERHVILETLHHCLGNRTHAANILGISIRTLRNKLKQYSESNVTIPAAHDNNQGAL